VSRKSWLAILLFGVILLSGAGLSRLRFETDILEVLPKSLSSVQALQDFQKHFAQDRQVIVLLQSNEEEIEEEDAGALASHLRERWPDAEVTYKSAFEEDPELFAESVALMWSYAPPEHIAVLMSRLVNEELFKKHLGQVKEDLKNSFDQQLSTMAAYDPIGFLQHPGLQSLLGSDMDFQSDDGKSRILLISRKNESSVGYKDDLRWVQEIRSEVNQWLHAEEYDITYQLTGGPVYNAEIGSGMERDMSDTVTITALVVGLIFLLMQRSFLQLLMIGLLLGLTFFITLGVGGWVFGTLNLVSVGFAAILLGLVIDYAVVIIRDSQHAKKTAGSIRDMVAPSILWAAFTTAIVFGVLMMSTFAGVQQLGGLIVIGLLVGAIVMLVFTPLFLEKFPVKPASKLTKPWFLSMGKAGSLLAVVLTGSGVLFAIKGFPKVSMNLKMIEPESSEAAKAFEIIQKKFAAWSEKNVVVITSAKSLEQVGRQVGEMQVSLERLQENKTIKVFQWPHDLVPNKSYYRRNVSSFDALAEIRPKLLAIAGEAGFTERGLVLDQQIFEAIERLPARSDDLAEDCANDPLIGAFFDMDEQGKAYFSGRMKLVGDITPEMLVMFDGLDDKGVSVTGWSILQSILQPQVKKDFYAIFIPSAGILLLALFLVFRSWKETLIAITVLLTALVMVNAVVVLTGQAWNFLSGVAIPLVVGAGIDYSIHLIFALRRQNGDLAAVWNSVGKAIFFCGLSTAIGFGSLLFASNEVLRSMGLLCSLGILLTMALSLLIIPGFWHWSHRRRRALE
jgi:predicted RND superfamily exporter protein